jgi:hypothetical protein
MLATIRDLPLFVSILLLAFGIPLGTYGLLSLLGLYSRRARTHLNRFDTTYVFVAFIVGIAVGLLVGIPQQNALRRTQAQATLSAAVRAEQRYYTGHGQFGSAADVAYLDRTLGPKIGGDLRIGLGSDGRTVLLRASVGSDAAVSTVLHH